MKQQFVQAITTYAPTLVAGFAMVTIVLAVLMVGMGPVLGWTRQDRWIKGSLVAVFCSVVTAGMWLIVDALFQRSLSGSLTVLSVGLILLLLQASLVQGSVASVDRSR